MELLLILTYASICIAIFKIFRVPVNKWTVPTAVLGGILIIGVLITVMNYNHPYSESTRGYYPSIPIVPQVRGRITEIPVRVNEVINKDDVLFRLEDTPFRDKVEALEARLNGARDEQDHAAAELERSEKLKKRGAGSDKDVQRWRANYDDATAKVDDLVAQLDEARFNLESTVVRAPSDGIVTQMLVRPGMMAGRIQFSSVMSFIPLDEVSLVGWYRQNSVLRLKPGDEAEVAFDALPGKIIKGRVKQVIPFVAEGQLQPTADLVRFSDTTTTGRVAVEIQIEDPEFYQYNLPQGLYGQSAIYTEHAHHVAVMRRILLRMASWLNYLFPFH